MAGVFRTLEEFNSPEEILTVLRDVVEDHKYRFLSKGTLHRAICPRTIFISPTGRGVLAYPSEIDLHCYPANPIFSSISTLAGSVLQRKKVPSIDYFDDLESIYYTLIFLATAYRGPGQPMSASERESELPHKISVWINDGPATSWSVLEKEVTMLCEQGFGYHIVQPFFVPFALEILIETLHDVLHARYVERMDRLALGDIVDGSVDDVDTFKETDTGEKIEKAREDYDVFLCSFDLALQMIKDARVMADTGVVPDSIAHIFSITHVPAESDTVTEPEEESVATEEMGLVDVTTEIASDDSSDDSSSGYSTPESSPVDEKDSEGDWVKKGVFCATETNNLLLNSIN